MRILRSSVYADPFHAPLTTVARECDLVDTLESARLRLLTPGALVIFEIFEMVGEPSVHEATRVAMQRTRATRIQEKHQAMLYHWTLHKWGLVSKDGLLLMDKPAPLSREEICVVFDQLAEHPDYRGFTIISHTRDGEPVRLVEGRIE